MAESSKIINLTQNLPALIPMHQAAVKVDSLLLDPALATDPQYYLAYARSFPVSIGGAQDKFGLDIYSEMRSDACVGSSERKLKQEVLAKQFAINVPEDADARTIEIAKYEERCLLNMEEDLVDVAWQMLDCMAMGHSLTEITWGPGFGTDTKTDMLSSLRVIPAKQYTIVLDAYGRFLGVIGRQPGRVPMRWVGPIMMALKDVTGFVPYWKLCIVPHSPNPGDLRGNSRFDAAYNPFRAKKENWANWLFYQRKFGRVRTMVTLGPDVVAKDPALTAEQEWTAILAANDYDIACLPKGSTVTFETFANAWEPYSQIMAACNREIALAIATGARSITEGEKSGLGNSDSAVAQGGVDLDTDYMGDLLCRKITKQVLRPLVKARFGQDAEPSGIVMRRDEDEFNETASALSIAWSDLEPEQQDEIAVKRLGIKPSTRTPDDRREEKQNNAAVTPGPDDGDPTPKKPEKKIAAKKPNG